MLWALVAIAGLYAIYVLALFFLQQRLIFPGAPHWAGSPVPGDTERLWIKTPLAHCEAFFLPRSTGDTPCPALLFAHGNAERMEQWIEPFRDFAALGLGVLLVEYPGYGHSHGTPSQSAITQLMTTAFDTLAAREDVDEGRIVAVGRSVGGAAVLRIPPDRPAALVLMSTFTRVRAFALPLFSHPSPCSTPTTTSPPCKPTPGQCSSFTADRTAPSLYLTPDSWPGRRNTLALCSTTAATTTALRTGAISAA